jgi:chromosome segregation ATPase
MSETDSLWLQKSITVPDPLPEEDAEAPAEATLPSTVDTAQSPEDENAMPPPSTQSTEKRTGVAGEMDLTKMVLDTSSFLRNNSAQRPSMRYPSRASVSTSAFISAHEYDDLRARYSQAKRELLKLSDIQKDLDFAHFGLARAQEEANLLRESNQNLKRELEEYAQRWEKEHKSRMSLEAKMSADGADRAEEVALLKQTIEDLRQENAKRLDDMTEQQESEFQSRMQSMRDELTSASEEVDRLLAEVTQSQRSKEAADAKLSAALSELEKARTEVSEGKNKIESLHRQCQQLEQQHREFVSQQEASRAKDLEEQKAFYEDRVQQLTSSKEATIAELQAEAQQWKSKLKVTSEELAAARHSLTELQEDIKLLNTDHAKELRRLTEEHRLTLCEKQLQMETAVREAKGSKTSVEEEAHSLRRQLSQVSSELSTVAGVLAQREKQMAQMEADLTQAKERCLTAEQENAQLASDVQMSADAAAEATERVDRLMQQKDELEEAFSNDLRDAKDRIRTLEAALMQSKNELSGVRKEQIKSSDDGLATTRDLRAQIDSLMEQRVALTAEAAERRRFEDAAADYRKRFEAEKSRAAALEVELTAAVNRCSSLETKLEEQSRRLISQAKASRSPMQDLHTNASSSYTAKYRSVSSAHSGGSASNNSLKRARTEDARVFAISGFDGNNVLLAVKQLPNVAIAECKSNMPVPSNLTHLISNGQLTIKLLTALVRGCWVLPESYVVDSLKEGRWLREEDYGFQHEAPPLLKKRVALTEAFTAGKHYSTASLLLKEGGAIVVDTPEEADILLCSNSEARSTTNGWNWEKMVDMINPLKVA